MKKMFSVIIAMALFVVAIFSFNTATFADDSELGIRLKNSNTFYRFDSSTQTLYINGTGDMPNMSSASNGVPWYSWDDDTIQNVVVSEGVTSIGNYAFYQVRAKSFSLPRSLKRIGRYSMALTLGMKEWNIPFGVETIDAYAFYNCVYLQSITLPSSLKIIGEKAFNKCISLNSITIPSSTVTIGASAFADCRAIDTVVFASLTQTTAMDSSVFMGCSSLKQLNVPMNSRCGISSFGYANVSTKYSDFSMGVFYGSPAYSYAIGNSIDYTIIDSVPIKCGVEYANSFTDDTLNKSYHYTFTPDTTQEYIIYSMGGCDTYAKLYLGSELICENDDIDQSQNGFGIRQVLEQGVTYDLYVTSMKMDGTYKLRVYPTNIESASVYGDKITFSASDGKLVGEKRIYTITRDMLSGYVIDLSFSDSTSDSLYFDDYIAGNHIKMVNNQYDEPFCCGNNDANLSFGDMVLTYNVFIEHSFEEKNVEPTPDEDGYTFHYCINCNVNYKDNIVTSNPYVVTGRCVMDEDDFGGHPNNVPYSHAYITVDGRRYNINADGTWSINTFNDCYITFNNMYGGNSVKKIDVTNNGSYDFGTVALEGYDLNADGYVNAKDYVIYKREKKAELGENYWQFGDNYLIWQ